jgi:hypothetical protein
VEGLRCPSCGETRWHLLPVKLDARHECTLCGTEMVPERRRPGRKRKLPGAERRTMPSLTGDRPRPPAAPA